MLQARIIAQGSYLPSRILSNQDLEAMVETNDEWIFSRTGIKTRRIAADGEHTSTMGSAAAKKALANSGLQASDIDMILVATMTPDYLTPSTAALIQHELGASKAAAFDMSVACSGYLYALATAKAYVESGLAKHVLVVASEKLSSFVDWTDRKTCVLFGDGAGACIVSSEGEGWLIDAVVMGSDGELSEIFKIPAGGARQPASEKTVAERSHYMVMEGKEVFRNAVKRMVQSAEEVLAKSGMGVDQIDKVVCHQANIRILEAVAERLGLESSKLYKTVEKYGNTSASSLAIALEELMQDPSEKELKHVLLLAFGAGLTWGGALLENTSVKGAIVPTACDTL